MKKKVNGFGFVNKIFPLAQAFEIQDSAQLYWQTFSQLLVWLNNAFEIQDSAQTNNGKRFHSFWLN